MRKIKPLHLGISAAVLLVAIATVVVTNNLPMLQIKLLSPVNGQVVFDGAAHQLMLAAGAAVLLTLIFAVFFVLGRQPEPEAVDFDDSSQREQASFRRQAYHDALTRLPNRALFDDTMRRLNEKRLSGSVGILLVNLDQFKSLNDSLGPKVGDRVLRAVAKRVGAALRKQDRVFRIGGDEFIVVMPNAEEAQVKVIANRILGKVRRSFLIDSMQVRLTTTVGVAMWPLDSEDFEQISRCADLAVVAAKEDGGNRVKRFMPSMRAETDSRINLIADLPNAIKNEEFVLHYQPRLNARTGQIESLEALLRWQHPQKGLLHPESFMRVVEDSPLILQVGSWVLEKACEQLMQWHAQGHTSISISVNVAARQFRHRKFVQSVRNALERSRVNPAFVELEITETQLLGDLSNASQTIEDLKLIGLTVSIDDFGTGYSSLAYLHKLPIDVLKIDRTFVAGIGAGPKEGRIAQAITSLGHTLGLKVVAEGVETEAQAEQLREWGCDQLQGFLYGKPQTPQQISKCLTPISAARTVFSREPAHDSQILRAEFA